MHHTKIAIIKNHNFVSGLKHKATLNGYRFIELFAVLGCPQRTTPNEDDSIQFSWALTYHGKMYTIYDWNTHDRLYSLDINETWHIGAEYNAEEFLQHLIDLLEENRK
jgi:hypothetical protein